MCRKIAMAAVFLIALGVIPGVLGFYRIGRAAPTGPKQPFANPVRQRQEIIEQLKTMNRQLREQNKLLSSGQLKVIVVTDAKK